MNIEFIYFAELESFIQILILGMILSLPVCFIVEGVKATGITKPWFYFAMSILVSAGFGVGFAMTFTKMNIFEGAWLSVCLWLGSQGFYEKLKVSNGVLGKMFVSVSQIKKDNEGLGEPELPEEGDTEQTPPIEEDVPDTNVGDIQEELIEEDIPVIPTLPQAEKRDIDKEQIKVTVSNLRVRTAPVDGEILGYAEKGGFYTFSEATEQDGITWYKVGSAFIGDDGTGDIKVFKEGEEDKDYLIFPVNYVGISGDFTKDHPAIDFGYSSAHGGKNQPIIAPSDMKITKVGEGSVIGKYILAHATVGGKEYTYRFIHLSSYSVSKGDTVKQGEKIGKMGDTGSSSGGYHLHFDVWNGHVGDIAGTSGRYDASVNPLTVCYLAEGQVVGDETDKKYKIMRAK